MRIRGKSRPWVISIALHVTVLAAIGVWAYDKYENKDDSRRISSRNPGAESQTKESTKATAQKSMAYQQRRVLEMSGDEKRKELQKRLEDLDEIYFRDVKGAAGLVESLKGVKQDRRYEPNPAAKGKFESKSATLYDITRKVENGKTVYVHTLVDAEGRTARAEIPAEQMSADDLRAFEVFEIARRNPKLRFLVDAALRIGENMVREGSGE